MLPVIFFFVFVLWKKIDKTRRNINWLTLSSLFYYLFSRAAYISEVSPACSSLFCSVPGGKKRGGLNQSNGQISLWLELR